MAFYRNERTPDEVRAAERASLNGIHAMQPLFSKNAEIQNVLNAIPFAALLIDSEHNLLVANERAKQEFDLDRRCVAGKSCLLTLRESDRLLAECPLAEAIKSGVTAEREVFDASRSRWIKLSVYPHSNDYRQQQTGNFCILRWTLLRIVSR